MSTQGLTESDPSGERPAGESPLRRALTPLLRDPRDAPILALFAKALLLFPPAAAVLFSQREPRWYLAVGYLLLLALFLGPYASALHEISHRRTFAPRCERALVALADGLLGPFFGLAPEIYRLHHLGMHHPENNLADDASSTLRFQRDSIADFARYVGRFVLFATWDLGAYFVRAGKRRHLARMARGTLAHWALVAAALAYNWRAALVVFVVPIAAMRFALMAGNWAQHAFVDPDAPASGYSNSATCVDSPYNRGCFNAGYHAAHHIAPGLHWTELPASVRANLHRYRDEGATIFRRTDFGGVWVALMLRRYEWLADRYVDLRPCKRSQAEVVALLRARTARQPLAERAPRAPREAIVVRDARSP